MAVDSVSKRFSIMDFGGAGWAIPIPDGTFDQGDRQHFLCSYSGILWTTGISVIETLIFNSYIELSNTFASNIETSDNFDSYIETSNTFKSEVK